METNHVNNIGPDELKELVTAIVEGVAGAVLDRRLDAEELESIRQRAAVEVDRLLRGVRATVQSLLGDGNGVHAARQKLTPPELARQWRIKPEKILAWIRSGELRAINVATEQRGRPRYLIEPDEVEAFEQRRAVVERPVLNRRRGQRSNGVPHYF